MPQARPSTLPDSHATEYRCPDCLAALEDAGGALRCGGCDSRYPVTGGIIDFRSGTRDYYFNPVPSERMEAIIGGMSGATWAHSIREFLRGMPSFNPDWLDNLVADGRYSWKFLLDLGADSRVLDLGCGLGNLTRAIAPHVGRVYALDLTLRRLEFSRERFAIFNRDDDIALLAGGDRRHLPFADASLDCVILSGVLEWVGEGDTTPFAQGGRWQRVGRMLRAHFGESNPRRIQLAFLREIRRVLKPDGQLFVGIENRLNHEYFAGRPDHHSRLKYGSLLPRFLATIYSIVRNRAPYRTYTYSLGGYRRLLREAGFRRQEFWGLTRGYSHLEEILPAAVDLPALRPAAPAGWRERVKRHPLFVPAYGIIADNRPGRPARMQDAVLDRVRGELDGAGGAGDLVLRRYIVTPKDKLMLFASHAGRDVVIKLPCNDTALAAETANADMLDALAELAIPSLPVPRALGRGRVGAAHYFVESRLAGAPLAERIAGGGPQALSGEVARLLDAMASGESPHARRRALEGALYRDEVERPLHAVLEEIPRELRDGLQAYFAGSLRGHEALIGPCHGDFGVNNVLVEGDAVSGVIDWEGGRGSGVVILDTLSYLLSVHHRVRPDDRVAQSVPALAGGAFLHPSHERLLAERYTRCGVDDGLHAPLVHLAWLRMAAQHLRYGLAYNPVAIDEFVTRVVRHILGP